MILNKRIFLSSIAFCLVMLIINLSKPSFIFNRNGDIKPFGCGKNKTIYSLGVVTILVSILCLYIFTLIDKI